MSVAIHVVAAAFVADAPRWRESFGDPMPLTVRLEPARLGDIADPAGGAVPPTPAVHQHRPAERRAAIPGGPSAVRVRESPGTPSLAPLPAVDATYYAAGEIDVYPKPVSPLGIPDPAGTPTVMVRLSLHIDERGKVDRVSIVQAEPAATGEETLRALIAGTRFTPAIRGDKPVKSHVHIEVRYGPGTIATNGP